MAAGQGFKTFTTGEVLTAGDVNGYLMQGINVFATTTARDAAITAPAEGQFAFTKDTNGLWYYDGAAWVASGATGDIEGVTAGVGISGGGTSGTVTVTNSMATAIDAKGDLVPGTGADTFARLAVGANDTVLTADSTTATGLKWAAAAAGGMTLISTTTLSGSTVTIGGFGTSYKAIVLVISKVTGSTADTISISFDSSNGATMCGLENAAGYTISDTQLTANGRLANSSLNAWYVRLDNYTSTTLHMPVQIYGRFESTVGTIRTMQGGGLENASSAISQVRFLRGSGNFTGGTVYTYGVS
jgi:hypothetical protein